MTLRRHTPVNLRQSGNSDARILINTQVRKSPYWHLSERHGCWAYTVLSNLYHPRAYVAPEDGGLFKEHEYLTQAVTLWNVAAERQIAIKGPDAEAFANRLVTRELKGKIPVGKARYTIVCNEDGGIVNDPVLLRVAEDEIWLSTHTEVLFYAQGVRVHSGYDVRIEEVDVSPLQIQGPNSKPLMESLVAQGRIGREVLDLKYYTLCQTQLDGIDIIVTRTGFSGEVGYELYPFNATDTGETVWNAVLEAGQPYGIQVIAPSHIRRLEAGILSYHADMDHNTTPYEVGLDWQVDQTFIDFALASLHYRPWPSWCQGVSALCRRTSSRSTTTASATDSTKPTITGVAKSRVKPSMNRRPRPPWPIRAVTVTSPIVVTAAIRMPAMIIGNASGSSTWNSRCVRVRPIALAASITCGETPRSPSTMFRTRISSV